jgi:hypothetical protein
MGGTMKAGISISCAAAIVAAGVFIAAPRSAEAQVSAAEAKCRQTIAKSMAKFVKAAQKQVAKCHKLRNKGKEPATTDCNALEFFSDQPAGKAYLAVGKKVNDSDSVCAGLTSVLDEYVRCPYPFDTVDNTFPTDGIDNFAELTDCLLRHAELLVERNSREVLGLPEVPLTKDQQKCHSAMAKGYDKLVDAIAKETMKCQKSADASGGTLGFSCLDVQSSKKVSKARSKLESAIADKCEDQGGVALSRGARGARTIGENHLTAPLGSCGESVADLQDCMIDRSAVPLGSGLSAFFYKAPDQCPASGDYSIIPVATQTEVDFGFSGLSHDLDLVVGYRAVQFGVSCNADCTNCVTTSLDSAPGSCRCDSDVTVHCSAPGPDAACGGGECSCYFGPPTPLVSANAPICLLNRRDGPMTGSFEPMTLEMDLGVPLAVRLHLGISLLQPCPTCVAGVCSGGPREGLPCSVDASVVNFGDVSHDCPPDPGLNVSGLGTPIDLDLSTTSSALPPGEDCGAMFTNLCTGGVCSVDPAGDGTEGECAGGPVSHYCDGILAANGQGVIVCATDFDCQPGAIGVNAGACTLSKNRDCFLDPVEVFGIPGDQIGGVGCAGETNNPGINAAAGLPGPYRFRQNLDVELYCSDGVTPFQLPGGANCL